MLNAVNCNGCIQPHIYSNSPSQFKLKFLSLPQLLAYMYSSPSSKVKSNLLFSRADEVHVTGTKSVYTNAKLILTLKKDNLYWRIWHQRGTSLIIFFIQLNNVNKLKNQLLPSYVKSSATRWHITQNPTATSSISAKIVKVTFLATAEKIGPLSQ